MELLLVSVFGFVIISVALHRCCFGIGELWEWNPLLLEYNQVVQVYKIINWFIKLA